MAPDSPEVNSTNVGECKHWAVERANPQPSIIALSLHNGKGQTQLGRKVNMNV